MRAIPVGVNSEYFDLFILLEADTVRQMKAYDPAEVLTPQLADEFTSRKVHNIVLMYATAEDLRQVDAALSAGEVRAALRILSRGYGWRASSIQGDRS